MYQVINKQGEVEFKDKRYAACAGFLMEEVDVLDIAEKDYYKHKEGIFNEDEFAEFMWANLEDYALEAGFTIKEIK